MLHLNMKPGDVIWVGDIPITYIERHGVRIRLGIQAPREVPVDRDVVRKSKEAAKAAGGSSGETK